MSMIIQREQLSDIRSEHAHETLVLTSGTFDLMHTGHLRYLETARSLGDILVVMLSGDERVRARKGPQRPIIPEQSRAEMLNALRVVDYVFIDPATAPPSEIDPVHAEIAKELNPDYYTTDGPDPRFWGIIDESKFKIVPDLRVPGQDMSTSAIVEHIRNL